MWTGDCWSAMSVRVVIDTNVLVSAYWTRDENSPTVRIYRALLAGAITALVNDEILSVYRDVLHRSKFGFNAEDVERGLAYIAQTGETVFPSDSDETFPDADDKVFYCTAQAGGAQLVTGNMKHYPPADFVLTPAQFCETIGI